MKTPTMGDLVLGLFSENRISAKDEEQELSFSQILEDAFYEKFPEEWNDTEDYFAVGDDYIAILNGECDYKERPHFQGEQWTEQTIIRKKRIIWKVGHVCYVAESSKPRLVSDQSMENGRRQAEIEVIPERKSEDALGKIRLTRIDPDQHRLYFEVVE